jgi:predicted oxidoreductase
MHWGSWGKSFDTKAFAAAISGCLDMGVTSFDHADIYGHYTTEAEFGKALLQLNCRKEIQLITKCGINLVTPTRPNNTIKSYDSSAIHIIKSVEQSLKNFNTDYIDVLLLHRPDMLMQPDEIASAITKLQQDGKLLEFGVSNFSIMQMQLLQKCIPLHYNQIEISPLHIEAFTNGVLDYCMLHNIVPMAWSPMKGGLIYSNDKIDAAVISLAAQYNCHKDEIIFAWLKKHPANILPITGSSQMDRIGYAVKARSLNLTAQDWYLIYTACLGKAVA